MISGLNSKNLNSKLAHAKRHELARNPCASFRTEVAIWEPAAWIWPVDMLCLVLIFLAHTVFLKQLI